MKRSFDIIDYARYQREICREETSLLESEMQSLRNSLRYRVGGWMLEAFPPGWRTFVVLWRLTRLYAARMRGGGASGKPSGNIALPEGALKSSTLVFGTVLPTEMGRSGAAWRTENAKLMALRLDSGPAASALVLRLPASDVLRRIARAKLDGTHVIWWPEDSTDLEPALVGYARAHAHECRGQVES